MPANDGEQLPGPWPPAPPPRQGSDPAKVAAMATTHRRADRLRRDADTLFRAARIADKHNCPAIFNANMTLAEALKKEADRSRKGFNTVPVKRAVVNGKEEPLV